MFMHSFSRLIHIPSASFHNLKKFSANSANKFTTLVHKELKAKILPDTLTTRMAFQPDFAFSANGKKRQNPR
jgi:hypothetical protein